MALPDKVIDDLVNDPAFVAMSPDEQDSFVEELDQEMTGTIPNTENFLQRAMRNTRKLGFSEGFGDIESFGASGTTVAPCIIGPGKIPSVIFDGPEPKTISFWSNDPRDPMA